MCIGLLFVSVAHADIFGENTTFHPPNTNAYYIAANNISVMWLGVNDTHLYTSLNNFSFNPATNTNYSIWVVNISAFDKTGADVLNYNLTYIYEGTGHHNGTMATSNGSVLLLVQNQTGFYNISIDAPGYAVTESNLTLGATTPLEYNISLLYNRNSLEANIYDEITDTIINNSVLDVIFIGDTLANITNISTSNGSIKLTYFLNDTYEIRYEGSKYPIRSYYITFSGFQYYNITMFSLNYTYTSFITFTVTDSSEVAVKDVVISANRLFPDRSAYKTVAMCRTDADGQCGMYLELLAPYSFTLTKGTVTKFYDPAMLLTTDKTLIFSESSPMKSVQSIHDVNYNFSYNNATNRYKLIYSTTNGLQHKFCVELYNHSYQAVDPHTYYVRSCQTSSSGTILVDEDIENKSIHAVAYYVSDLTGSEQTIVLSSLDETDIPRLSDELNTYGIFFGIIFVVLLGTIGANIGGAGIIIGITLGIGILALSTLISLSWGSVVGFIVLAIMYISGMSKK